MGHPSEYTHIYIRMYVYIYIYIMCMFEQDILAIPCPNSWFWLKHISPAKYMQTGKLGIETDSSGVLVSFGVLKSHAKVMFSYLETRFLLTWINSDNVVVSDTGLSPNLPNKNQCSKVQIIFIRSD